MPVTQNTAAPYAPAPTIMSIVERYRERGLPVPVNAEVLARAGVSESLVARTLYAMEALDLIDEDGKPTPIFDGIRLAPAGDYQARLGEWLTGAYADVLQFIDPAGADEVAVRDAFRGYRPHGQLDRMVTLFLGLFRAAGIAPEKGPSALRTKAGPFAKPRALNKPRALKKLTKPKLGGSGTVQNPSPPNFGGDLPPAITGLLSSLPTNGNGWTQAQRDAFLATFAVVVDFCFPPGVVKAPPSPAEADDETDA